MSNFVMRFFLGFGTPFKALSLIRNNRRLLLLSIFPMLITIAVGSSFIFWGLPWFGTLLGVVLPQASGTLMGVLYWVGMILGYIVAGVFSILGIVLVANIASLPFNSLLAEETLKINGFLDVPSFTLRRWTTLTLRMLRVSLLRSTVLIGIGAILFIISLIPFVQFFSVFMGFVLIAFDSMDYSLELKELGLRQRFRVLRRYFWEVAGFGCCFGLTSLIPFLNFLLLPIGVVSGALLVSSLKINALE